MNIITKIDIEINEINKNLKKYQLKMVGRYISKEKLKRIQFYKKWFELKEFIFPYKNNIDDILHIDERELLYNTIVKIINKKSYDIRDKVYLNNIENCLKNHKNNLKLNSFDDVFSYFYNPVHELEIS